jgi:hypothetical protein
MKRVSDGEVILTGTSPAITLRHEQNYTYDTDIKRRYSPAGEACGRIRPETREKRQTEAKVWAPVSLIADAVKVSRVCQNVLI